MIEHLRCGRLIRRAQNARAWAGVACGAPATVESGEARCRNCRLLEDQRAFGPTFARDIEGLRHACHAAEAGMALMRYYPGEALSDAHAWRGVRIEAFAFPLSEGSRTPLRYPDDWVFEELLNIDGPCIVARWRFRHPGKPGTLDVTWNGHTIEATPRPGPKGTPTDAARLMALWHQETVVWRRSKSQEEFIQIRGRRLADYCRERGVSDPIALSRKDVAEALVYATEESLRNALNTAGATTEHLKAEAYRLLRAETHEKCVRGSNAPESSTSQYLKHTPGGQPCD